MKNICFISQVDYIDKDTFNNLIKYLGLGYNLFIYYLPPRRDINFNIYPDLVHYIGLEQISYHEYKSQKCKKITILSRLFNPIYNFLYHVKYGHLFAKFIKEAIMQIKPDVIIIASDAGTDFVPKIFFSIINSYKIPSIILYPHDIIDSSFEHSNGIWIYRVLRDISQYSFLFVYLTMFANLFLTYIKVYCEIPGFSARYSKIFVISPDIKSRLIKNGVKENCIALINYKENYQNVPENIKNIFLKDTKISPDKKIVIYYTEALQQMPQFGISYFDYFCCLNQSLIPIFHRLIEKNNIEIFIKPHPREPKPNEENYYELVGIFENAGIPVIKNYSAAELITLSDLSIGHYSTVLIESILIGTKFLSINIDNRITKPFLKGNEREIFEIKSLVSFEEQVIKALYDDKTKLVLEKKLIDIQTNYSENSNTLKKVAEYIKDVINDGKIK